jgi:hypothetical protein
VYEAVADRAAVEQPAQGLMRIDDSRGSGAPSGVGFCFGAVAAVRPSRARSWIIPAFSRPKVSSPSPPPSLHEEMLVLEDRELALLAHGVGEHLPIELAERVLELRMQRATLAAGLALDRTP